MKNYYKILLDLVEKFRNEFEKFEKGNKTAGTRARNHLQEMKKVAQEARVDIQNEKNSG